MAEVVPALRVSDVGRSRRFYEDGLGFRAEFEHRFDPDSPAVLRVSRDGMTLDLSEYLGDAVPRRQVRLYVPDVDAWYVRLVLHGFAADYPPTDRPGGGRDFRVTDPDGNAFCICTPADAYPFETAA